MKKLLGFLAASAALAGGILAQPLSPGKVPAKVRKAFQAKFPKVSQVEWKLKGDKNYEAEFMRGGVEVAVKFDSRAKWLETETAIEPSELTKEVRRMLATKYKGYKIIETQKVERAGDKRILFEVHLENAKEVLKVLLRRNGKVTSQTAKPKRRPELTLRHPCPPDGFYPPRPAHRRHERLGPG